MFPGMNFPGMTGFGRGRGRGRGRGQRLTPQQVQQMQQYMMQQRMAQFQQMQPDFKRLHEKYGVDPKKWKLRRRISKEVAVVKPHYQDIAEVCKYLQIPHYIELNKKHPRDFFRPSRVRVLLKKANGELYNKSIPNKYHLLVALGKMIPKLESRKKRFELEEKRKEQIEIQRKKIQLQKEKEEKERQKKKEKKLQKGGKNRGGKNRGRGRGRGRGKGRRGKGRRKGRR